MNIKIWTSFIKRTNSTKQPTGGTDKTVVLKRDCTIDAPSFILNEPVSNITYVQAFGNYYFVDRVININANQCEIQCSKDRLATYKTEIGAYNCFIERAQSVFDNMVTDNLLTVSNTISHMQITTINMPVASGDLYVVPVFGRGGVLQYVFPNITDASKFFNTGTTMTINGDSVSASDWLLAIKNAGWAFVGSDITSYMGDMMYIPYLPPVQTPYVTTNKVIFGFYEFDSPTNLNVLNPLQTRFKLTYSLTDPDNVYTDFRAYDPRYSVYKIYLPGCGIYDINSADAGKKDLKIDVLLDFLTMAVTYRIYHNDGSDVAMFEGKFGTGVPAMGAKLDVFGILQDTAGAAASIAGENMAGAAGRLVSVADKTLQPQVNARSSGAGNGATLKNFPHILYSVKNFASREFATANAGRPLFANRVINTMSGFIKCGNASIPLNGENSDREIINNYLNSGFYFE